MIFQFWNLYFINIGFTILKTYTKYVIIILNFGILLFLLKYCESKKWNLKLFMLDMCVCVYI